MSDSVDGGWYDAEQLHGRMMRDIQYVDVEVSGDRCEAVHRVETSL